MKLDIDDGLYAALMSAIRLLERTDPKYAAIRKALLRAMLEAARGEMAQV